MPRRAARVALAIAATVAAVVAAGLPLYVFPHSDKPAKADAVIILGPGYADRRAEAQRLVDEGYAPRIYLSVPASQLHGGACSSVDVTCFVPDPFTTRGEARFTERMAAQQHWSRVIVITGGYHATRARYIFDSCATSVDVRLIGVREALGPLHWAYQYAYQTAAFGKAFLLGCAGA